MPWPHVWSPHIRVSSVPRFPSQSPPDCIKHTMGPVTQTVASPFMTRGFGMIEPWEGAQASLVAALGSLEGDRNGAYFAQVRSCRRKLRVA